jgi:ABC-type transport system substrate-binding protein/DNA-binding SARP family transcriptional activator
MDSARLQSASCRNLEITLTGCLSGGVEFAILGAVEARDDARALPLGGGKQRAVFAFLLLHANEVVSRDRLIDAVWGDRPPPSVHQSLDSYVSRLRRALGSDRLVRRARGYVLLVEPGEVDLERFEQLLQAARDAVAAGDDASASSHLRAGLALWRGPALADLLYEPFAAAEAERLEGRRLGALEERIDADLASGAGPDLVPELEALVREHPLQERLLGQLMIALYRAGRHADALSALQAARHRLANDLGLEPGPQLRELERRILQHDPGLEVQSKPVLPRKQKRSRALVGAAAVVVVAAGTLGGILATRGGERPGAGAEQSNRLLGISARSGKVVDTVELPGAPASVSVGFGSVWVAEPTGQRIARVDPTSGSVVDRIPVSGQPGSLTTGGRAVWVASTLGGRITRVDPRTGEVAQTIRLGGADATAVAFGEGAVWVADSTDQALIEIDPATGSVRRTLTLDLAPTALAVGGGIIWVAGFDAGVVEGIDSRSGGLVSSVAVGRGPSAIGLARDAVWVVNTLDATVSRVDPATGSVSATIPVPSGPGAIAVTPTSVWVAGADAGVLAEIDPRRNMIASSRRVGGRPEALVASSDRVWVASGARGDLHRGGTLTLVRTGRFLTIDPALAFENDGQFTRLAYDTLVTFQAAVGPAGLRLLPDIAIALPRPTEGGRTYAFRLRPGLRYSDGRPLRAPDFRRAIDRLFRLGSPGASYYSGVVGAGACRRRPQKCDLSAGIETDGAARTVVFRLRAPDPDFLYKLAVLAFATPIPPGTPDRDIGALAVPGTGPYRIAAVSTRGVRFVRNPFFREWSHAAQPAGNPDVIVWRYVQSRRAALQDVESGRADWFLGVLPPDQLRSLHLRYPSQIHANPAPVVDFIHLNTHRPPFDDIRVRRALNYAIDRAKIAGWYGGPLVATPLCQPLAPGLPGYRRYCPYTRQARSDGRWSGPDLARAQRLVAASGTAGDRVDVWGESDSVGVPRQVPSYIAQLLRTLGYRVRLHVVLSTAITSAMRRDFQLSVDGDWLPDYPAPSAYLPQFFGCSGGNSNGYFCDPALDRRMRTASMLQLTDPAAAASRWAAIDRQLVDEAAWVPTVNVRAPDFVSKRVRNYQYNPVKGFLPDQVWLR